MAPFPQRLESERLVLRRITVNDAKDVFAYATDPMVAKYMTFRQDQSFEDVVEFLSSIQSRMDNDNEFNWAIELRTEPGVIGSVGCKRNDGLEIGYVLRRDHWGQGYMPEAVQTVMRWALANEPGQRIWATCDIDNDASASVLIRVGMVDEGVLPNWKLHPNVSDAPRDSRVFSLPNLVPE